MTLDRRSFLQVAAASGALASLPALSCAGAGSKPKEPLKILILGGTGFLGPAIVNAAQPRGHVITLFNRGKTNPGLFPTLEKLQGDRDPNKGEGIASLAGRKWDVVFDDCGYYPRHVKASAELLAPNVAHYVYVSSISCYARNDIEGIDENGECAVLADPTVETMGEGYANYGGLKALCERATLEAFPSRATIVRPGYIVGPTDPTDRFTYWPARMDRGGDVLVPGNATDPVQVIDVRDLAEWMVLLAEQRTTGVFNACGPRNKLPWGDVLSACQKVAAQPTSLHWASAAQLAPMGIGLPIWAPYEGETKGFHTVSNARAVAAGLKFRDIDQIVADTLKWFREQSPERQAQLFKRNLASDAEARAIEALRKA